MANPLDSVMLWYRTVRDSIRVTRRVLDREILDAVTEKHVFFGQESAQSSKQLSTASDELDDLVVLALTAFFERTIRDYLLQFPTRAFSGGDPHTDAVRNAMIDDIEYWNMTGRVIDLFPAVPTNVRGIVKQIIEYRNWVAHGKTISKLPSINVLPAHAYQNLTEFLRQAGVISL